MYASVIVYMIVCYSYFSCIAIFLYIQCDQVWPLDLLLIIAHGRKRSTLSPQHDNEKYGLVARLRLS